MHKKNIKAHKSHGDKPLIFTFHIRQKRRPNIKYGNLIY